MDPSLTAIIGRQFEASIEMLGNALRACPDDLWHAHLWEDRSHPEFTQFWYVAYHALFWLDLYLSGAVEGFAPPPPFSLEELDPAGVLPERPFARAELLAYLDHNLRKCRETLEALTDAQAQRVCRFPWGELSFLELILDNMRHVQEHAAQLNMLLGQQSALTSRWVSRAKKSA